MRSVISEVHAPGNDGFYFFPAMRGGNSARHFIVNKFFNSLKAVFTTALTLLLAFDIIKKEDINTRFKKQNKRDLRMELRLQRNAIKLIRQIADHRNTTTPIIPYKPQKSTFNADLPVLQPFARATPESQGISSARISDFIRDIQNDKSLDMHCLMIMRNGHVVSECSFGAYKTDVWHVTHSMCKSVTGLAIGLLIGEGRLSLDDRIIKIFEGRGNPLTPITKKGITVRHLLTMTSGIAFNEAGAVTEEDWVESILNSSLKFEPGKEFLYNSMNSYMLSAIIKKITGKGLTEYLKDRLFEPLGIFNVFWETCPKGIEKGGWGLYIRPEDIAKIGQLFLRKGRWNDKQIISEEWVENATTSRVSISEGLGDFDYGYHIWAGRKQHSFLFNGMFGQNVIGFPDTGILIVSNAGNNELFQQSSFFALLKKYFGADYTPPSSLPENRSAYKKLINQARELRYHSNTGFRLFSRGSSPLPPQCSLLSGKTYAIDEERYKSVGLFPLIPQALQNNYSVGIRRISFSLINGRFLITIHEEDVSFELPIGFSGAEYTTIDMHGEPYITGTYGSFATDEDDNPVLKLRFSFIEIANSRSMKLIFSGDDIIVKCSENPGRRFFGMYLDSLEKEITTNKLVDSLLSRVDTDYFNYKLERTFEPVLRGRLESELS